MPANAQPPSAIPPAVPLLERGAGWVLRGPLTWAILGLAVIELALWLPNYLVWPLFADHDVFLTAAQAWDAGILPYRDFRSNNFPGTIYLCWLLGQLFGWGRPWAFFGADAALVLVFGTLMLVWSRRCFGALGPGAVGLLTFLGFYLNLDYSQAAQRDWQGPFFAVAAVLIAEAWPGRAGRWGSAWAMALGFGFRPQIVLLLPAWGFALAEGWPRADASWATRARAGLEAILALALGMVVVFAPLVGAGVGGAFVRAVRQTAYGSTYNRSNPATILEELLQQLFLVKVGVVGIGLGLLAGRARPETRRMVWTWMVALLGVFLYRPLSPRIHAYLSHPMMIVWTVGVAVLVQLVREVKIAAPTVELTMLLLIVGLGTTGKPRFCNPRASLWALKTLREGRISLTVPPGYVHNPELGKSALYDWGDYRKMLEYLRAHTAPTTRVANVLKGIPAVNGMIGRLSPFPAESIGWLYSVRYDDEAAFAQALQTTTDAVVVWSPAEAKLEPNFPLERIIAVIRTSFAPEARFGSIEVWRRQPDAPRTP
jgi:hypothetical protein